MFFLRRELIFGVLQFKGSGPQKAFVLKDTIFEQRRRRLGFKGTRRPTQKTREF